MLQLRQSSRQNHTELMLVMLRPPPLLIIPLESSFLLRLAFTFYVYGCVVLFALRLLCVFLFVVAFISVVRGFYALSRTFFAKSTRNLRTHLHTHTHSETGYRFSCRC